jgi:hypothetical protein
MLALVTADPSEPSYEIAAVQEFADHFRDGRAKGAKVGLVLFWDYRIKRVVQMLREGPQTGQWPNSGDFMRELEVWKCGSRLRAEGIDSLDPVLDARCEGARTA